MGKGKGKDKCKFKKKEQKISKTQKSAKKNRSKTRVKDYYVKRTKNRLTILQMIYILVPNPYRIEVTGHYHCLMLISW